MRATFPSRPVTRWAVVAGAVATALTTVVFAWAFSKDPSGFLWMAPYVGGYVAGVVAFRARPDLVAARRLVVFGAVATAWIGSTVAISEGFDELGRHWWLGPGNVAVQVLGLAMWAAMIALLAVYPDGTYRRRRHLTVVRALTVLAVAVPVALLVVHRTMHPAWVFAWDAETGTGPGFPDIASPLHVPLLSFLSVPLRGYVDAALAGSTLLAALVAGARYRSLPVGERLAMRWPIYGVVALLVTPLSAGLEALGALSVSTAQLLQIAGLLALPASLAVGVVRPDLFDVDRAMRRSLVYASLWTAIAAAYVGGAAALGMVAPGEGVQLAIAATIGATLLFEPARRHLARRAARWAYGETVSGEELVRRLGGALEHTLDLERLIAAVASIAREGMGLRWVRVTVDGVPPAVDGDGHGEPATASAPMVLGGERLGDIECGPPSRERGGPAADRDLLATLARQAALAVHNARLASELRARLAEIQETTAELAASRSRLVAAHESARRQIERDIHDGAQQELVALIAGIGLARHQLGGDPGRLDETLAALQTEAADAFDNLRRLAAGIHPAVLSDHGLVEAIDIRSSRLPLDVTVDYDPDVRHERFGDEIEGAAYFFVSEALANALKHAGAARVRVAIVRRDAYLEIVVSDDGAGFDATATPRTGLRGLADRVDAVGGTLDVTSAPGSGTRLTVRLPVHDRASV